MSACMRNLALRVHCQDFHHVNANFLWWWRHSVLQVLLGALLDTIRCNFALEMMRYSILHKTDFADTSRDSKVQKCKWCIDITKTCVCVNCRTWKTPQEFFQMAVVYSAILSNNFTLRAYDPHLAHKNELLPFVHTLSRRDVSEKEHNDKQDIVLVYMVSKKANKPNPLVKCLISAWIHTPSFCLLFYKFQKLKQNSNPSLFSSEL